MGLKRTKNPKLNSIKLNNFSRKASIKPYNTFASFFVSQTPLQVKQSALLDHLENAGGGVRGD